MSVTIEKENNFSDFPFDMHFHIISFKIDIIVLKSC